MTLTTPIRKHLLGYGAIRAIAKDVGVDESYVSRVVANQVRPRTEEGRRSLERMRAAVARRLNREVDDVFPPLRSDAA